jgi:hypothetical protein
MIARKPGPLKMIQYPLTHGLSGHGFPPPSGRLFARLAQWPDPCKPSLPFLAKTTATSEPLTATYFFLSLPHSQQYFSDLISYHFYSFSTQILHLLANGHFNATNFPQTNF